MSWGEPPELERSRALRTDASDVQLRGLGLQLMALREPALQGRAEVQRELVEVLARCLAARPEGTRKIALTSHADGEAERVARWLCRAADAQGVARVVRVADPLDAAGIVAAALCTSPLGLTRPDAAARLLPGLGERARRDVERVVSAPEAVASLDAAARVVGAVAERTPLVLCGHTSAASAWIDRALGAAPSSARLAAVVTGEKEDGAVELAPLTIVALVRTLRDLVGLDGRSADVLAERAEGSTRALVRLVAELQQRGALVEGPRGLVARDDASLVALPAPGTCRLRGVAPLMLAHALDVVALVGEWAPGSIAATWIDADTAEALAVWLERSGALTPRPDGAFTLDDADRASWVATMPAAERALVARALLADPKSLTLPSRDRAHLMRYAGDDEGAWRCAAHALEDHLDSGAGFGIFERLAVVRQIAAAAPTPFRAAELEIFESRAESALQRARPAIARAEATLARVDALPSGAERDRLKIRALVAAASPRALLDELEEARELLLEAGRLLVTSGWDKRERPIFLVRSRLMLGFVHFQLGEYPAAIAIADAAIASTRAAGDPREHGNALYARALFDAEAPAEELAARYRAALDVLDPTTMPLQVAFALGAVVPHLIALGRLDEALEAARQAVDLSEQVNSREVTISRFNRGVAFARAGR